MVGRNLNFAQLKPTYLFVDIARRKADFLRAHPSVKLISLGVGDTTEPLFEEVLTAFKDQADRLGNAKTYTGYPEYNGTLTVRQNISKVFYPGLNIKDDEIFISDGSKPDLARLQLTFSPETRVAVQDPVYPVYVDGSVISGKAGSASMQEGEGGESFCRYDKLVYMDCTPENQFFPDLDGILKAGKRADLIYFCSPNNPTGAAATRAQLERLVRFAKQTNAIIIYDAAYCMYVSEEDWKSGAYPRSIFEIEGAKEVALETNSFSKILGYTGVRLGWTVCPKELKYSDGTPVWGDWSRIMATCFNGPSNLAEAGALAAMETEQGRLRMKEMVDLYAGNARIIVAALQEMHDVFEVYGGTHSPYIWVRLRNGKGAWEAFQELLEKAHVVVTPGVGFGVNGKQFIRISAFAHREDVLVAVERIRNLFQ